MVFFKNSLHYRSMTTFCVVLRCIYCSMNYVQNTTILVLVLVYWKGKHVPLVTNDVTKEEKIDTKHTQKCHAIRIAHQDGKFRISQRVHSTVPCMLYTNTCTVTVTQPGSPKVLVFTLKKFRWINGSKVKNHLTVDPRLFRTFQIRVSTVRNAF